MDNTYLDLPFGDEDTLLHLQTASISYRIALGKDAGKKVFTLKTLSAKDEDNYGHLARIECFSLHAGGSPTPISQISLCVFEDTLQDQR
jgi:hypothetical protein